MLEMASSLHDLTAALAIVVVTAGVVASLVLVLRPRPVPSFFDSLQAGVVAVIAMTAMSGLIILTLGSSPAEGLHFLYAALAVGVIPPARSFFGRARVGVRRS